MNKTIFISLNLILSIVHGASFFQNSLNSAEIKKQKAVAIANRLLKELAAERTMKNNEILDHPSITDADAAKAQSKVHHSHSDQHDPENGLSLTPEDIDYLLPILEQASWFHEIDENEETDKELGRFVHNPTKTEHN